MNTAFLFIPFGNEPNVVAKTVTCMNANKNISLLSVYIYICRFTLD